MDPFMPVGIGVVPVPEIADQFMDDASTRACRRLEVVGTFAPELGSDDPSVPSSAMRVWSYTELGECKRPTERAPMLSLERLALGIESFNRQDVQVRGIFVGRTPTSGAECPQAPGDAWVIEDGPFEVWVHGVQPQGAGWKLSTHNPSDASRWLAVTGRVTATRDCILLKARDTMLLTTEWAKRPPR
jgi:hypothetical protein